MGGIAISQFDFIRGMTGRWSDASGILKFHLKLSNIQLKGSVSLAFNDSMQR
jgi:hypothetical protein